jgi:tetratricopeptide (TPR) repeat protein
VLLGAGAFVVLALGGMAVAWGRGDDASKMAQTSSPPVANPPAADTPAADTPAASAPAVTAPVATPLAEPSQPGEDAVPPEAAVEPERAPLTIDPEAWGADPDVQALFEEPNPNDNAQQRASQLVTKGDELRARKELRAARARYLEALRLFPTFGRALLGLTQIALQQGDGKAAEDYALKLVVSRSGQAGSLLVAGDVYAQIGQAHRAHAAWDAAASRGCQAARARLNSAP